MKTRSQFEQALCINCPGFALSEEIQQLQVLRKLRLKTFKPAAREIVHLDEMIHARLVKLMGR